MRHRNLLIACLLTSASLGQVMGAQGALSRSAAMPDSAQMGAMMARALRRMQPAQFVLDHRAELALTPEQVPFLESLVLAELDSARVRNQRRQAAAMAAALKLDPSKAEAMLSWTGPVDEAAIRQMARDQAEQSADYQIDMARDRRAVGAVLTSSQLAILSRLEATDMMSGAMRSASVSRVSVPASEGPYFEFQVERPVTQAVGTIGPKYPDVLRASGTTGEVLAQFVVDSAGHYEEGSFRLLKSSHDLFTQAVRAALPQMRFVPAELRGAKVRQLVQQPFIFTPGMK